MPVDKKFIVNLKGKEFVMVAGLLDLAHQQGLVAIDTEIIETLCQPEERRYIVRAVGRFRSAEGEIAEWSAHGDADGTNTQMRGAELRHAECVPLRAEILTRDGWVGPWDLRPGEPVLAYDGESDRCLWTPLLDRRIYEEPQPLIELKSKSFRAVCTPEHTWAVRPQERGGWRTQMVQTRNLNTCQRIVIAAPAESGDASLTPREAAILGWLSGDGWISATGGKGIDTYRAAIAQSKPETLRILRDLLGADASEQQSGETERTFPTGRTYKCRAASKFELKAAFLRPFLEKVWGLPLPPSPWEQLEPLICRLSQPARAAMLEGMLLSDGWKSSGKKPCWSYGQKAKPGIMDLFGLLVTLEGRALGAPMVVKQSGLPVRRIRENRFAATAYLGMEMLDPEPVWCPMTTYGTWVMRLDGYITITGNTRAIARMLRFATNVAMTAFEELGPDSESTNGHQHAPEPRPAPQRAKHDPIDHAARKAAQEPAAVAMCAVCGEPVDERTAEVSRRKFAGEVLCVADGKARLAGEREPSAVLQGA